MKAYTFPVGDKSHAIKIESEGLKMVHLIVFAVLILYTYLCVYMCVYVYRKRNFSCVNMTSLWNFLGFDGRL